VQVVSNVVYAVVRQMRARNIARLCAIGLDLGYCEPCREHNAVESPEVKKYKKRADE